MNLTDIIVVENKNKLSSYITEKMSQNYFVRYFDGKNLTESGRGYMLDVISCKNIGCVSVESGIIIIADDCETGLQRFAGNIRFIVSSSSEKQLKILSEYGYPAITCGNLEKDTVSFTSHTDDTITVSLNRKVSALSGKIIQPLEIPLEFDSKTDIYTVLSHTALRILLDDFNSDLGKLF